jgi:hypothetical protein
MTMTKRDVNLNKNREGKIKRNLKYHGRQTCKIGVETPVTALMTV